MSSRKLVKSKSGLICAVPGYQKALELEVEKQNDHIRGLEHDIKVLKTALAEKDALNLKALDEAVEKAREEHEVEKEEMRTKHHEDLQTIQNAQTKYDEALFTMTQTCEGFEQDNELLSRMIKKQKTKIKELHQGRADDEEKIKKLMEGIKAIEDGESNILEGMKTVCEGQEKELKLLEEQIKTMNEERNDSVAILAKIYKFLKQSPMVEEDDAYEKTPIHEQLLHLENVLKQILNKDGKPFNKSSKSRVISAPQSVLTRRDVIPVTNGGPSDDQSAMNTTISSLKSTDTQDTGKSQNSIIRSNSKKSFLAPKTNAILRKMKEDKKHVPTLSQTLSYDSDQSSVGSRQRNDDDYYPTKSEVKSVLNSNSVSKEFKLVEVVNKALRVYFNVDQNVDENEIGTNPIQFISEKSLETHHVQEFRAHAKFWYSVLSVRGKTWDPSAPSFGFKFPGGLVGSRMGKIVYSTKEYAIDALLIFVLKTIDPSGVWMDDFFGEDEFSCILRKEGALRNNPWLVLMRKSGHIFLSYVADVTSFKKPIIMA